MKFAATVRALLRAACALLVVLAAGAAAAVPFISLDEIEPGMTGYGLSVFEGARVDTFAVTVVGVQRNARAAGSLILVEVAGHGLENARIVQGMSGSPVFLDGRLAGALASGWSGSLRAVGGVTPAEEMLRVTTDPPPAATGVARREPLEGRVLAGEAGRGLARDLGWPPDAAAPGALDLPVGWPAPADLAQALLGPSLDADLTSAGWVCVPAGVPAPALPAAATAPTTLVPGAACAVPLVTGDAQLGAIGTVTWVEGDDVWMMGHPFMQRGPVRLPLATASIFTVLPTRQMSFKLGAMGPIVGAVHQDRRPALAGRLGAEAPLLPVAVRVEDPLGRRDYRFAVADDPLLAPALVFWTGYSALLAEADDASLQTVRWRLDVDWRPVDAGDGPPRTLSLEGLGAGPNGALGLGRGLLAPLGLLLQNPFTAVRFDSVRMDLALAPGLETATILGVDAPRRVPVGAASLPVTVELAPRRGDARRQRVELPLPAGLEPGRHRLVVASAAEFFGLEAQRAAARFEVVDLQGAIDLLESERGAGTLTVALLVPGRGAVVRGRELDDLPGSLEATLRRSAGREGRTLADFAARLDLPTPWLLDGHAVLDLEVADSPPTLEPERRP